MPPRGKRVTASQVGHYVFCARAWWFNTVKKLEPINVEAIGRGITAHEAHGWQVVLAQRLARLALGLLGIATLLVIAWSVTRFLQ